jgi:SAM-dependent methyltransferase
MISRAYATNPDMRHTSVCADGGLLPFPDASFDCVCEFGVLHHTPSPKVVVAEMMRVARKVVILSDENRYGMRGFPGNIIQLAIVKARLWPAFYRLWTGGKGYQYCEEDGIRYSFSVYDCYPDLRRWAAQMWALPLDEAPPRSVLDPLLTSSHVLLCAFRKHPGSL